jgi:hypothetical protein
MAVTTGFKQQCPSCEALVPVKDAGMIGKKIDCPKCKYKFVVEQPAANGAAKDKETKLKQEKKTKAVPEATKEADKTKESVKAGKPKTKMDNGKAAEAAPAKANGKSAEAPAKAAAKEKEKAPVRDADGDEGAEAATDGEEAPKKKKKKAKAGSQKMMIGIGLAAIGLVVLAVAGYFLMNKKGTAPAALPTNTNPPVVTNPNIQRPADGNATDAATEPKDKEAVKKSVKTQPVADEPTLPGAGAEITNLLPNDSEHVLHVFFKNIFHLQSPLREPIFAPGAFVDQEFRQKLGIAALAVDDLIRAQRFTEPAWTFTVVHTVKRINEEAVAKALELEPVGATIKGQKYYLAKDGLPWLEELGQVSFGAPEYLRWLAPPEKKRGRSMFAFTIRRPSSFPTSCPCWRSLKPRGSSSIRPICPRPLPPPTQASRLPAIP